MCFSSGGDGGAAQAQSNAEAAREANISTGMQNIDGAFSQFDDPYYQSQAQAYSDYYQPQVQKQYGDARQQLILNLGHQGTINSSEAARQLSNLDLQYNQQQASQASAAQNFAAQARNQVENSRNQLVQELNASADPAAAAQAATSLTASLATPPAFSPLGNLFATAAPGAANAIAASTQTPSMYSPAMFSGPSVSTGGGGSSTIVN